MRKTLLIFPVCAALFIFCFVNGCERAKHFFFEIPDEAEPEAVSGNKNDDVPQPFERSSASPTFVSMHSPVKMRDCAACHDAGNKQAVREDMADQCAACHSKYFSDEIAHGPVAEGDCSSCHLPHQSQYKSLLTASVFDVCTECHDSEDLSEEDHSDEAASDCTKCHDPHFGESPYLKSEQDD